MPTPATISNAVQANLSSASSVQTEPVEQTFAPTPQQVAAAPPKPESINKWLMGAVAVLALAVVGYFVHPYIYKQRQLIPPNGEK